jgi:iron-sulfur cluster insertion protein
MEHTQEILKLTDNAIQKVYELVLEENNPDLKLRIFVQGGGCSGFQYGFTFDDFIVTKYINEQKLDFLIDATSATYLRGVEIDYSNDLSGSQFIINNPNVKNTCGCGSSFST